MIETLNEYQAAIGTHNDACPPINPGTSWYFALKLCGEAGEVAELVGKSHRLGEYCRPIEGARLRDVALELGDVLWYVTMLARGYGFTLQQIAEMNLDKITKRYPTGGGA